MHMDQNSQTYRPYQVLSFDQLQSLVTEFKHQSQPNAPISSLSWFNSHLLPWEKPLSDNIPVALIELGGTYVRTGIGISHSDDQISWLEPIQSQPALNRHSNREHFISWLSSLCLHLLAQHPCKHIGFIFSYPHQTQIHGKHLTAVLTSLTKGLRVPDLVNHDVSASLIEKIQAAGHQIDRFVTLNDTVATALAVRNAKVGVVVGTGGNIASCRAETSNIFNLEVGNFDALPHTQTSSLIDLQEHTGKQSLEKQTTGRYLHRLLAQQLIIENVDISIARAVTDHGNQTGSLIVDKLARGDMSCLQDYQISSELSQKITSLANVLLTTSAQAWAALTVAAVELNYQSTETQTIPVAITGGVALDSSVFQSAYRVTLTQLSSLTIDPVVVPDPLRGAVVAALQSP